MVRQAPVICVMAPPIHLGTWSMALMLLSNPDKFPYGFGTYSSERPWKLTYRLLDVDKRISRDLDYLFVAQYIASKCQMMLPDDRSPLDSSPKPSYCSQAFFFTNFFEVHCEASR